MPWTSTDTGWNALEDFAREAVRARPGARTFKAIVRRVEKKYPLGSQDVAIRLGGWVVDQLGLSVDLKHHDLPLHVDILGRHLCLYVEKMTGLRGLPKGSSGRALCLFSGGIDSPVAAWLMMARGLTVDLLHFHPYRSAAEVQNTKIFDLDKALRVFQPGFRLYLVPHDRYQVSASLGVPTAHETVFFRRFMFRAAEVLAQRAGHGALVTGDSLGQVASQTLENLAAVQTDLSVPVFQPLIAQDKESVVRIAQKIGTYEPAILPYKDCCSLLAKKPKTNVSRDVVRQLETKLDVARVIEESLAQAEVWDGKRLFPWTPKKTR